ncbi:MAG: LysM peptidoglycan-binding domain-containing protein [Rikenellaceae bacterium]|nr:LysM peptidoglycan-binding domain-containing protein [Rikenellaceae bacterium]
MRYCDQTFDPEHLFDFENGQIKFQTFALERSYFNINSRASDQLEDHDFDDYASLVNADGEEITSEDIVNYIAQSNAESAAGKSSRAQTAAADTGEAVYHTIKSGDMLGKLAIRYGVSIDQICRLNGISRTTVLQLGRKLRIR